jgi:aminoglycoside 2'-N-acetyltransferase I
VKIGGIGGVKTHPEVRGRGFATAAIKRSVEFFQDQGDIDFGLLVCAPQHIPFYERIGWRVFPGDLLVTQHGVNGNFTFNTPMTFPIRLQSALSGTIDLLGPPW